MKTGKLVLFILLCICLAACSSTKVATNHVSNNMNKPVVKEVIKPKKIEKEITIAAVGDMLIHDRVYKDAKVAKGYDFRPMLASVKPFLRNATITIANQETMIGGKEIGLSSYPSFNSPVAVGDALKDAGVDVVSIANNHTLDRGEKAIQQAIKHWEAIDMMYTGAYKNKRDSNDLRIYQTDEGISVVFLSYTYGTNGIPVPEGKDYLVNLIDRAAIASAIKEAKKLADVTVISLHFGNEYERLPNESQKDLVQFVADLGVNVVIGHHPHVLQPVAWVKGKNGNKTFVAYSLGNFLSGQDEFYTRIGGMVKFTIKLTEIGGKKTVAITSPKFLPTYVDYHNWSDFKVIPMFQLTNDILPNAVKTYQEIKDHMAQWMPELEFITD